MRNIHELERQWIRYKIRSYAPWIAVPTVFLLIITIGYFIWPSQQELPQTTKPIASPIQQAQIAGSISSSSSSLATVSAPIPTPPAQPEATVATFASPVLTPSLNFIERLNQKSDSSSSSDNMASPPQEVIVSERIMDDSIQPSVEIFEPSAHPKSPQALSIGTNNNEHDIEEVIARFKTNKKPALSLFIAKRYYSLKLYRDAYNYALITNELDPENEESWLVAAKALVKLNEKEKAQHLLGEFIARSDSVRAKMTLAQIENGTLE